MRRQPTIVVALELAGTACRIECDDPPFARRLEERYARFAATRACDVSIDVRVVPPPPLDVVTAWSGHYARVSGRGTSLAVEGLGFTGAFDDVTGRGHISQPPDAEPLETLLTAVCASRLLGTGGFMLHAATIIGKAGALVFFGPSGSGKTTVSELVGHGVLTDEITAIRPERGRYLVSSVPWRGEPTTAPLGGLFRLRQAASTSFRRLSAPETVRDLLPNVFFSRADAAEFDGFMETAETLARVVPAHEMRFTRDRSFWDVVPGAA